MKNKKTRKIRMDSDTKSRKKYKTMLKKLTRKEVLSASYRKSDNYDKKSDSDDSSLLENKFLEEEDEDLRKYVRDFKRKVNLSLLRG